MDKEKLPNCSHCGGTRQLISFDMEIGNFDIREFHDKDCPALEKWDNKPLEINR